MRISQHHKKHLLSFIRLLVIPIIIVNLFLLASKNLIESSSKKMANQFYEVRPENSYEDNDAYLMAVERQKLIWVLLVWLFRASAFGLTFFIFIRPNTLKLVSQLKENEKTIAIQKSDQWKSIFKEVKSIFNEWDPIGVVQDGILDEYDTYALQITGKIINNESQDHIKKYLNYTLTEVIGLKVSVEEIEIHCKKFVAIKVDKEA